MINGKRACAKSTAHAVSAQKMEIAKPSIRRAKNRRVFRRHRHLSQWTRREKTVRIVGIDERARSSTKSAWISPVAKAL